MTDRHDLLCDILHSVWIHGNWRYLTKQMTTTAKEAFADAVEAASVRLDPDVPRLVVDRWWQS